MTDPLRFRILGTAESKANSRKLVSGPTGRLKPIKSWKARKFVEDCKVQCPKRADLPFTLEVELWLAIYYPDERRDLDESLVLDALQAYSTVDKKTKKRVVHWPGIWLNDRLCRVRHVFHFIDAANPRVEGYVKERDSWLLPPTLLSTMSSASTK